MSAHWGKLIPPPLLSPRYSGSFLHRKCHMGIQR